MADTTNILIGKIVAPQGIRGDVRVQSFAENPTDLKTLHVGSAKFNHDDFRFVRAVPNSDIVIAHINGIDDRNAAETMRGVELFVARDSLPRLADGEFYQSDLIDCMVVRDGVEIGRVVGFQNFGAGDIMELDNGEMILYRGCRVDLKSKKIFSK